MPLDDGGGGDGELRRECSDGAPISSGRHRARRRLSPLVAARRRLPRPFRLKNRKRAGSGHFGSRCRLASVD